MRSREVRIEFWGVWIFKGLGKEGKNLGCEKNLRDCNVLEVRGGECVYRGWFRKE